MSQQSSCRVLAVGECMIELRRVTSVDLRLGFAGDAYNTAVYLQRTAHDLGAHVAVSFLTGLGTDPYSALMREAWAQELIEDLSFPVPGHQPGLYLVSTDDAGERSFSYWRDGSAAAALFRDVAWVPAVSGDRVHFSGVTLQLMPPEVRRAFVRRLEELRGSGTVVSFDTNFRPGAWPDRATARAAFAEAAQVSDIVFATLDDESMLVGETTPADTLDHYLGMGASEVLVKLGARGVEVGQQGCPHVRVPAAPVTAVVDTTAAGDSFAGAYLAARIAGRSPVAAARVGADTAAHVITQPGAIAAERPSGQVPG